MNAGVKRSRPGFLVDDPRHMDLSEYLKRPDHELVAADCQSCHDPLEVHNFLPYKQRHLEVLACRSCHVPELFGPAMQLIDSTVVTANGSPALVLRGFDVKAGESLNTAYDSGYAPVLRRAPDDAGHSKLAPFNAVSSFAWVSGPAGVPVPWDTVTRAFLEDGRFDASVLAALDANGDGDLDGPELRLDTPAKVEAVRARLASLGIADPRIGSAVSYFPVRHGVQSGAQVMHDCNACHAPGGRLAAGLPLAPYTPAGLSAGPLAASPDPPGLHVFGHTRGGWMDRVGFLLFVAVVLVVAVHATIRFLTRRSRRPSDTPLERVYLYTTYERIWHWLMAGSVLVLMFTGLQVHFTGDHAMLPLPARDRAPQRIRLHPGHERVPLALLSCDQPRHPSVPSAARGDVDAHSRPGAFLHLGDLPRPPPPFAQDGGAATQSPPAGDLPHALERALPDAGADRRAHLGHVPMARIWRTGWEVSACWPRCTTSVPGCSWRSSSCTST